MSLPAGVVQGASPRSGGSGTLGRRSLGGGASSRGTAARGVGPATAAVIGNAADTVRAARAATAQAAIGRRMDSTMPKVMSQCHVEITTDLWITTG